MIIQPGRVLIAIGTSLQLATLAGVIHDGPAGASTAAGQPG
jgi:hypothetical protein